MDVSGTFNSCPYSWDDHAKDKEITINVIKTDVTKYIPQKQKEHIKIYK